MTEIQQRCVAFGRQLLYTGDLDPLYVMVTWAELPSSRLKRFLLAYSMYYHAGVACQASELDANADYWAMLRDGIPSLPRGTERRHFRGDLARKTISGMAGGPPEMIVDMMLQGNTFPEVFASVQRYDGYGPWIAFKVADMADRIGLKSLDFTGCELSIYRDPVKGAALWRYGDQEHPIDPPEVGDVVNEIGDALGNDLLAPPLYDRPINIQEVETIMCKFKSHYNGHYPAGKDTREILHGLAGWGYTANLFASCPLL